MSCSTIVGSMSTKVGATRPIYEYVCIAPSDEGDGTTKIFKMRTVNSAGEEKLFPLVFVGVIDPFPNKLNAIGWRVQFQYGAADDTSELQDTAGEYICDIEVTDSVDADYLEYFPKDGKFKFTICG